MAADLPPDIQKLIAGPSPVKKGSSLLGTILAMLLLTLAAAGAGGFLGLQMFSMAGTVLKQKAEATPEKPPPEYAGPLTVKAIPPIIVNLSSPSSMWLRIEGAVIFDGEAPPDVDALAVQISGDALAYLKTVNIRQIEGASGLLHLREDLTERAKTRSEGKVREFVIQAFAVE
jgi:flagellar FliL protein